MTKLTHSLHAMSRNKGYIDSEHYRQMLVQDGERRYQSWHRAFLRYQQKFLRELAQASKKR